MSNLRIAILGSTNGTSIRPVIDKIISTNSEIANVEIKCVLSNRKTSGILEFANDRKLNVIYFPKKKIESSEDYDRKLVEKLQEYEIDYVFLVGWMRILTPIFVEAFRNRAINIHPSLLPAFAGMMDMDIHRKVLERGCKVTGATIMYIDEGADTGPIIDQLAIRIRDDATPEELKKSVQCIETKLIENTLIELINRTR